MAIIDRPYPVRLARSQRHRLATKRLANTEDLTLKADPARHVDFAHPIIGAIDKRRQDLGEAAWADLVVHSRYVKAQCFVRSFEVVEVAPPIKTLLAMTMVAKALIAQHLRLERAVKPLVLVWVCGWCGRP